jgi:hypothetical protein
MVAVRGPFDVLRLDLRYLESTKPNIATQLENNIVPVVLGMSTEFLEFVVSHPDLVLILFLSRFLSHVTFYVQVCIKTILHHADHVE